MAGDVMEKRLEGDWTSAELSDMLGSPFTVGDCVAKAFASGHCANISIARVTRIEDGKLYLSESKVPIKFPGRLLNLSRLPGVSPYRVPVTMDMKMDHPVRV